MVIPMVKLKWSLIAILLLSGLSVQCGETVQNPEVYVEYEYCIPPEMDDGWETGPMKNTGIDTIMIYDLMNQILWEKHGYVNSILIAKDGKLIFEEYVNGIERSNLSDLETITKSIMGALTGIAIDRGYITGIDEPFIDYL